MTDTANTGSVHIAAEERPHPALQKLARACIALARLHRDKDEAPPDQRTSITPGTTDAEVCHG